MLEILLGYPQKKCGLLDKVSNDKVRGFSINVCNYRTTKESMKWSRKIQYKQKDCCYRYIKKW